MFKAWDKKSGFIDLEPFEFFVVRGVLCIEGFSKDLWTSFCL